MIFDSSFFLKHACILLCSFSLIYFIPFAYQWFFSGFPGWFDLFSTLAVCSLGLTFPVIVFFQRLFSQ